MKPFYPQDVLHEFLIFQNESVAPTKRTSWLRFALQLLNTPLLYGDQLVASTETPIGLPFKASNIAVHPFAVGTLEILKLPPLILQV